MNGDPDNVSKIEDAAWEDDYFSLLAELKIRNSSRYELIANQLMAGGEELLELSTRTYKISVDENGCAYSCREIDGTNFQRLGWAMLTLNPAERITAIADMLAECEARAQIDS